jgi:quercetin dioxygenase-like cupin family protein
MKKASFLPAVLLASAVAMGAQTSDPAAPAATQITVTPQSAQKVIVGTPNHFTGSARVQSLFDAKAPSHDTGGIVTFQPGARSVWHTHPIGQVLIVTEGEGWVQAWGGPVQVMRKGDVIWIPAGVKH